MTRKRDDADVAMIRLLREAVRPVEAVRPSADLWTRLRGRTAPAPARPNTIEWMILAVVTAYCVMRPATVSLLLFHF